MNDDDDLGKKNKKDYPYVLNILVHLSIKRRLPVLCTGHYKIGTQFLFYREKLEYDIKYRNMKILICKEITILGR